MSTRDLWILGCIEEFSGNNISKFSNLMTRLILEDSCCRPEMIRSLHPREKDVIFRELVMLDEDEPRH